MNTTDLTAEFRLSEDITYLNHAAVAPWPTRTAQAISGFATENATVGAMNYPRWVTVEQQLRQQLRWMINAPSSNDIALVKNTSEALSIVAYGLDWQQGDNIVISDQEFPSNRIVWESLAGHGVEVRQADLNQGASPEDALIQLTDKRTRLLAISSVQYATGLRIDLSRLGQYCREYGILFCVDAIQSIGATQLDVQSCFADFVMADGHKWMLGPEGLALFYCRAELRERLRLNQFGWHMVEDHMNFDRPDWQPAVTSRRFECGSPNMLGIHGLSASLSLFEDIGLDVVEQGIIKNSAYLFDKIRNIDNLELISHATQGRFAGIVTFRHKQADQDELYKYLMQHRVVCAQRGGGIRFSPHFYTTTEQMDRALQYVTSFGK